MSRTEPIKQRALDLGFFPVELDFPEHCWATIEQHSGNREQPALWMRHAPGIGDEVLFQVGTQTYRGRVVKRAFEAISANLLLGDYPDFPDGDFMSGLHLWLDRLTPCPHPTDASIWEA